MHNLLHNVNTQMSQCDSGKFHHKWGIVMIHVHKMCGLFEYSIKLKGEY